MYYVFRNVELDTLINKYVTVGENLTVTYSSQVDSAPMENALKMAPTVPVYEEDGVTFAGPY